MGLIPGSGRFPGVGNGNLLQYSCLQDSMDKGAWWATAHGSQRVGHDWMSTHTHSWYTTLCKFKVYNVLIWHSYLLMYTILKSSYLSQLSYYYKSLSSHLYITTNNKSFISAFQFSWLYFPCLRQRSTILKKLLEADFLD